MSEFVLPKSKELVDPISESECASLGNNTGLDLSDGETTCQALGERLLPLLSQIMSDISTGVMTIYANEDSKCEANEDPTLASMMSRIYRVSQAFACILCQYDPTLSNMLKAGTYPQVLMGKKTDNGYPEWNTPDTTPTENSTNVVTSGGVYTAIQNAILSVWHMWKLPAAEGSASGSYQYLVDNVDDLPMSGNTSGQWSLVNDLEAHLVSTYKWDGSGWVFVKTFTSDEMIDFSVVSILKGKWADKGLYWFDTGWNLLDADLREVEERIAALELEMSRTIRPIDADAVYRIGVANTFDEAEAVQPEAGVTKIIFVRGR